MLLSLSLSLQRMQRRYWKCSKEEGGRQSAHRESRESKYTSLFVVAGSSTQMTPLSSRPLYSLLQLLLQLCNMNISNLTGTHELPES